MPHWYAVRTISRAPYQVSTDDGETERRYVEEDAAAIFRRRGWGAYIPKAPKRTIIRRKPLSYDYPLRPIIPGLVMVDMPGDIVAHPYLWWELSGIYYVASIYGDSEPRQIPWHQVETMMAAAGDNPEDFAPVKAPRFNPEDRVKLPVALGSLRATVKADDGQAYTLLVDMLGSTREVKHDGKGLERVD